MRKIEVKVLMLFITCFLGVLTSCQKDSNLYDSSNHTSALEIPKGFTWSMTKTESFTIRSLVETGVSIYLDESCTESQLIAKIAVTKESRDFSLELPAGTERVYVQYPVQGGKSAVLPVECQGTRASVNIILPDNAAWDWKPDDDYGMQLDHYLYKGTVMFEDQWPEIGDYDFNDFVVYYETDGRISRGGEGLVPEVYEKEGITVSVQFRAIGGVYPYRLGLQLDSLPSKFIDEFTAHNNGGIEVKLLNPNSEKPAVFVFEGSEKLKGLNGANYYNTEKGFEISRNDLITVTFDLKVNCYNKINKNRALSYSCAPLGQNFFITSNKEIHLRGYAPTAYYQNYENDAKELMSSAISYYSKEGFVWGIKLPADTPHAIEKIDFIEAYPEFKEWVISGGVKNTNWYEHPNSNKIIQF